MRPPREEKWEIWNTSQIIFANCVKTIQKHKQVKRMCTFTHFKSFVMSNALKINKLRNQVDIKEPK
jgi:hypothetical protein